MKFNVSACCDSCHVIKGGACECTSFAQRAHCRNLWSFALHEIHLELLTVLVVLVAMPMLVSLVVLVMPAHTDPPPGWMDILIV